MVYKKKEKFQGTEEEQKKKSGLSTALVILIVLVLIGCGIFGAILSWRCNTAVGLNTLTKVVFAFFAFLGNLFYLIWYAMYQMNECTMLKRMPRKLNDAAMVPGAPISMPVPAPVPKATVGGKRR